LATKFPTLYLADAVRYKTTVQPRLVAVQYPTHQAIRLFGNVELSGTNDTLEFQTPVRCLKRDSIVSNSQSVHGRNNAHFRSHSPPCRVTESLILSRILITVYLPSCWYIWKSSNGAGGMYT